ncbi:MAG: DUF4352 domain-containing protein [Nitrosopumilus sp. H13]|nr:MAG: DUF4352 domain-containing protein [Nitrosopumilus sp. H13]
MVRVGMVIFIGAIVASMGAALYAYTLYQANYIPAIAGETVTVGPVEYVVTFDGVHEGSKSASPEDTFVRIKIVAKNLGDEKTRLSGGQFFIVDEREQKHRAVYGEFSPGDLLLQWLEPDEPVEKTTQFDISFDEDAQYKIIIRPQKEQSTTDTAVVCITNC